MSSLQVENANYNAITKLLVDATGQVLRKRLEKKALSEKSSIHAYLTARTTRQSLNNITPRVIKRHQVDFIYPPGGVPADIDTWDITLLCAVLICVGGLSDSERRDIEQIKSIRNATVGHLHRTKLENAEFEDYWSDLNKVIDNILNHIGDGLFSNNIKFDIACIGNEHNAIVFAAMDAMEERQSRSEEADYTRF